MVSEQLRDEVVTLSMHIGALCDMLSKEANDCFGWDDENDWGWVGSLCEIEHQLATILMENTGIAEEELWPKK